MTSNGTDLRDCLAAEYVLGTLSGPARRRFERDLEQDDALRALVVAWEERLGTIATALPVEPPPADLKAKLNQRLDGEALPDGFVRRAVDADWTQIRPGLHCRMLRHDERGVGSALFRLEAGAVIPPEFHDYDEECLVIEGDLIVDKLHLAAGDYCCVRKGGRHGIITSRGGAVFLLVGQVA
jgi:anti-sigma factor RsiW